MGLLQSSVVVAMASAIANLDAFASAGLLVVSVMGLMDLSHRMNYWGITYTGGWLIGLALIGPATLSSWELQVTEIVVVFFLVLKTLRKVDRLL